MNTIIDKLVMDQYIRANDQKPRTGHLTHHVPSDMSADNTIVTKTIQPAKDLVNSRVFRILHKNVQHDAIFDRQSELWRYCDDRGLLDVADPCQPIIADMKLEPAGKDVIRSMDDLSYSRLGSSVWRIHINGVYTNIVCDAGEAYAATPSRNGTLEPLSYWPGIYTTIRAGGVGELRKWVPWIARGEYYHD